MLTSTTLLIAIFLSIAFIIVASAVFKLHPFLALFVATLGLGLGVGLGPEQLIEAINGGFGGLLGYIGLIVVMGSIIGVILEKSGAAIRIADLMLSLLGQKRPALAMSLIGAVVSVPVFCDSGFIILSGLNKALSKRTGVAKSTLALALASGLYTTHTLIPPTPGPVAAAGNIGAGDYLGTIMLLGLIVSIPTLLAAYYFSRRYGPHIPSSAEVFPEPEQERMPGAFLSLAPILLPILLIAGGSVAGYFGWEEGAGMILRFTGHPLIALFIGLLFAFSLLPAMNEAYLNGWIAEGVKLAGPILVITGMGGAFGGVLKATPLGELVGGWVSGESYAGPLLLILTFLISALLKTAQGSSTSALVITSSILAPLVGTMGFDTPLELGLVVMALGGGAMTVSHANDSYFWVVSQFSGIEMRNAYRSYTVMTGLQGLVVLGMTLLLYWMLGAGF